MERRRRRRQLRQRLRRCVSYTAAVLHTRNARRDRWGSGIVHTSISDFVHRFRGLLLPMSICGSNMCADNNAHNSVPKERGTHTHTIENGARAHTQWTHDHDRLLLLIGVRARAPRKSRSIFTQRCVCVCECAADLADYHRQSAVY